MKAVTRKEPRPMGHVAIHETVCRILSKRTPGRLLDIPTGEGALASSLSSEGFEVVCADLYPEIFALDGLRVTKADLDGELPFKRGEFQYAVCVEGLEHIENPANAVREFARVIEEGGTLVVSVPNIMNIEERLKWLFFGYTSHFKPLSATERADITSTYPGMEEIALHVNPIGYAELRYLLETNGFTLEAVRIDKKKRNSWAYWPVILVVRLLSRLGSRARRDRRWSSELASDEVLRGGNTLIFEAVRQTFEG